MSFKYLKEYKNENRIHFLILTQRYVYWFERERKKKRETSMWERNINWLPPVCTPTRDQPCNLGIYAPTGDQTHNFLVYKMTPTNWAT